jgi:uncharacterized protein YbjT (DUF2867 family)
VKIAVAGGTGWVGRLITAHVRARGHVPVVLARSGGVDLTSGAGLDDALAGVTAVIDASNVVTASAATSIAFFEAATAHLTAAGQRAGVAHYVALSIVGCDRVDFPYYLGKRRQEELALAGPVPASVLRTTQFHEFAAQMLERSPGPFAFVPKMLTQPVAAAEVARALVSLALAGPAGLAPELAGPERQPLPDLVRALVRARGGGQLVVGLRLPGAVGKAMAGGALLPAGPGPRGTQTFGQWLAGAVPADAASAGAGPSRA